MSAGRIFDGLICVPEGVQKIADPSAEQKSKVTDKNRATNMRAKDDAKRTEQKAKNVTPQ